MDLESTRLMAKAICTLSMGCTAIAQGLIFSKGLDAMARNPEMEGSLFGKMIVGAAITESTAIYALVAFFII